MYDSGTVTAFDEVVRPGSISICLDLFETDKTALVAIFVLVVELCYSVSATVLLRYRRM